MKPQPWQERPSPAKGDPSTLASMDVTLPSGSTAEPCTTGRGLEVRAPSGIPPVTLAVGPTLVALAFTVRGSPMLLPGWSAGPLVDEDTVRATCSPPLGGFARVRCTAVAVTPSHETAATARLRPPEPTENGPGATDEHTSGFENVTASVVEPPVASSPVNLGGTVSTVTVRVTAGERPPALSTACKATMWVPSVSRGGACQAHDTGPASGAPSKQPWQELASMDATLPSGSLAEPW